MVLLSANGMSAADIADLLQYDPHTVRRWIARHQTEGVGGLDDRPRSGRPRLGSARMGQRIRTLLCTPKAWTTARVWHRLGRPAMSLRTVYRRIREQARWCRPRLIAKSTPDHALDLATGAWHYHLFVRNVSEVFCYFLDQLLPAAPVVAVICDNGSTHHSRYTKRWLAEHPRLLLLEGARYSPHDNPVERMWARLKGHIANTAPTTMADRIRQTHAFFRHRTSDQNLTTTAPWTSPWLPDGYGQDFRQAA
jgi:transposase